MLKVVRSSSARGLGGIAATYRAAQDNIWGTCPSTCQLNECPNQSTQEIDKNYLELLLQACPKKGVAWTYTHFDWKLIPRDGGPVVLNFSADDLETAKEAHANKFPTTVALPDTEPLKSFRSSGIQVVRCPKQYNKHINCSNCGGDVPLCARPDRNYIISFYAHGSKKKMVGTDKQGGCYAGAAYHTLLSWNATSKRKGNVIDDDQVKDWACGLCPRTMLRHHIAGDIGKPAPKKFKGIPIMEAK